MMVNAKVLQYGIKIFFRQIRIRIPVPGNFKEPLGGDAVWKPGWHGTRKEFGEKLGTGIGEFEECLVHQVQHHVLPANIGDECQPWVKRSDVCEILIRTDTEVHTAALDLLLQFGNDVLERGFIRDEVIRPEE